MKLRFDGKEYDLSTAQGGADLTLALNAFDANAKAAVTAATARADAADARATKAEADAKKSREDAADTSRLDAAVAARVALEGTASRVIGQTFKVTGADGKRLTDRQIREAVLRHDDSTWTGEGKDDSYVTPYFDAIVKRLDAAGKIDNVSNAITAVKTETARADANEPDADKARAKMLADNAKLFEQPSHKAN
jgi:hypothetical protein